MSTPQIQRIPSTLADHLAIVLIALVIAMPIALTKTSYYPANYYLIVSFLQLGFTACYAPQTLSLISTWLRQSNLFKALLIYGLLVIAGWERNAVNWTTQRSFFYLTQFLFVPACVVWFQRHAAEGIRHIFSFKLTTTLIASLIILGVAILATDNDTARLMLKRTPPIYRHLRHLNYDIIFVVALACTLMVGSKHSQQKLYMHLAAIFIFGFVSVWSAGRGQLLATLIFFCIFAACATEPFKRRQILMGALAFMAGAFAVFVSGETYFVIKTAEYSSLANSVDRISASRLTVWKIALEAIKDDWIFGLGPYGPAGALVRFRLVQTHNFLVQWLCEFGIAGTAMLCLALFQLAAICVKTLLHNRQDSINTGVAALLLSLMVYALVDGILFHAAPLTMFLTLSAFLIATQQKRV